MKPTTRVHRSKRRGKKLLSQPDSIRVNLLTFVHYFLVPPSPSQGSSEVWQSDNHSMIASLSFHPRDQVLAIATNDQILLWDWRQPVPFASVMISSSQEKVRLVRFSPLGQNLLTGIANAPVDEDPEPDNLL